MGGINQELKNSELTSPANCSIIYFQSQKRTQMKLAAFNYTDAKGKTKARRVFIVSEPSDKLKGIDVSELETDDIVEFSTAYAAAQAAFYATIEALKDQYDVKHNFRQFFPNKIEGMTSQEV